MAKNKTLILLAGILAFAWGCNIRQPNLIQQAQATGIWLNTGIQSKPEAEPDFSPKDPAPTPREKLVRFAIGEIGVREEGGNNRGKRIGEYLAATGLGQGHPWCAAFTKFVYDQNKIPTPGATAWSPSWFPKSRTYWVKGNDHFIVQKADVFGLYYPSLKRIGHVGIIEKVNDNWVHTIEGNTGDDMGRDGDVVKRHRRSIRTISKISSWAE